MSVITMLRIVTAGVWIVFGLVFKVLNVVPRHREIVAAVLGEEASGPVIFFVGAAETLLGMWVLSGIRPRLCAAVQTAAIVTMNAMELTLARHLLLSPLLMVCANVVFLTIVWYCALKSTVTPRRA